MPGEIPPASREPASELPDDLAVDLESQRRRQQLVQLLRGRLHWAGILALILGMAAAVAGYFSQKPLYHSTGRFEMSPVLPKVFRGTEQTNVPPMWHEYLNTQISLMKGKQVLGKAAKDEAWLSATERAGVSRKISVYDVEIERAAKTHLIDVTFTHEHPDVAYAGVQAVIKTYKQFFYEQDEQKEMLKLQRLQEAQDNLQYELKSLNNQLALASNYDAESILKRHQFKLQEKQEYEKSLNETWMALETAKELASGADPSLRQLAAFDDQLRLLLQKQQSIRSDIQNLRDSNYGPEHREVRRYKTILRIIEQQLDEHATLVLKGFREGGGLRGTEIATLRTHTNQLNELYQKVSAEVRDLGRNVITINSLNEKIRNVTNEMQDVTARLQTLTIEDTGVGRLKVLHSGVRDDEPSNGTDRIKRAMMGAMAGGCFGLGIVILIGLLDRKLRHAEEAEFGVPSARMLGILPTLPADLANPEQAVLVAHSVHKIRTLLQIGHDPTALVYAITSPAPGSGKTSLSIALGLSFAASDSNTLLIDCDILGGGLTRHIGVSAHRRLGQILMHQGLIREPQISEALRHSQASGQRIGEALVELGHVSCDDLAKALAEQPNTTLGLLEACGGEDFDECIAPTGITNLSILPIGAALPQQAGSLSPTALGRLIAAARARFDSVVVDTGPLLGSLEASMVAAEADGTLLIVSRGDHKPLVSKCTRHLDSINAKLAGLVFNHALDADIARSNYGSVTMSQSRHPENQTKMDVVDPDTSTRFGPLATAVATYAADPASARGNGQSKGAHPVASRGSAHQP